MDSKQQRVAAVTGAAGGLGLGIAQRLARAGYRVIAIDRASHVEDAAAALRGLGLEAQAMVLDIADEAAVRKMVAQVDAEHGRFDVLVNNAGIHPKIDGERNSFLKMTTAQWNEVINVNLTAAFVLCREVAPLMRRQKWGRIVNMSSRAGRTLVDTAGIHYAAAKAGMIGMTRIIASEVAADGITANCIAPGRIESPMTNQGSDAQRAMLVGRIPVGRIGTPDEIGHVVEFLVSEDSGYLTGTVIDVNGGTFMC
ncbi:3-oxoacyl-[acyl-carrier-protein] reductase FabG [Variovorax sp. PBL-H6]|uniref:SDR family oxidoreductase n=1 Tax=Variovorax sp. PBL-H6 TaxID=434009 RepID=UPI001317268C|nr:SDR family NAD(P)-dependent oxidoreductase [Variovorax sp. PBL-H6]VTU31956.1 3-oxoacyl-[acyl-carrier-protein] reductase FabG [Variovorax sp. PBL-H6]